MNPHYSFCCTEPSFDELKDQFTSEFENKKSNVTPSTSDMKQLILVYPKFESLNVIDKLSYFYKLEHVCNYVKTLMDEDTISFKKTISCLVGYYRKFYIDFVSTMNVDVANKSFLNVSNFDSAFPKSLFWFHGWAFEYGNETHLDDLLDLYNSHPTNPISINVYSTTPISSD